MQSREPNACFHFHSDAIDILKEPILHFALKSIIIFHRHIAMGYTHSEQHYYDDGDVIITCQDTAFRLHSAVLKLSSEFFKAKFTSAWGSTSTPHLAQEPLDDSSVSLAQDIRECKFQVELSDEDPSKFAILLDLIYPVKYFQVTWATVEDVLCLGDKYLIDKAFQTAKNFLEAKCTHQPLVSLALAERYRFAQVFKKSSTHIILNICAHMDNPTFHALSDRTQRKLFQARLRISIFVSHLVFNTSFCVPCLRYVEDSVNALRDPTIPVFATLQKLAALGNSTRISCTESSSACVARFLDSHFGSDNPTMTLLQGKTMFFVELD
ncbi:hypothetical protein BC936DRAFT_139844 [Jimgerdemannia flammicorona]|uniref:BTB domain-containing protein n=1 Tax=Jimgerdemannia flammicorona TaxID=994334 RepID=A0A433B920_9FUNG|nr:hypothetical protein BC936DRAFT_139844 [Jimgerdemannia flammicorona]